MVKVNKSKMTFKGRASISATFLIESVELKKRKRSQKSKDAKRVKTRKTVSEYSSSSTSPTSGPSWGQESNSSTDPQLSTPGPSRTSTLGVPSMGKSRKLSILPLLHREVMREYGDDELCGFEIHHSHVFIKLVSILNEKVFATFRNLENGFITLQKAWQFNKYNINKLEHGFSQHFTNKSEFPSPDFEVEEDLKKSIVSTDQSIRCNYPRCMCKGRVWPSRNAAHQHLQNVNVIYFCAACGQNFNARTTAVSHHRASCTYTKDGAQIEIIREINEIEKRKKRTKKKDENVDEFQNNDDTQDAEVNYGNFEPTISFDEFLKYCLELGVSQKVLDLSITIDEIKRKTSLEEKYILLSFLKTCKDLVLNQQNLKIKPTKNDMRIFHSKKYAFQIVKRLNSEPISVWELEYLITNSIRQVSMDDQLKYYCHYLQCPCSGQFFSTNLHELTRHIQIRNFSLVCFVCNRAFNSQKLLDEHYLPECKLPSAWQPDTLKSKFLTTYMKKNNFE